jgi:RNA polymerase sigma-70 factor, ECF subfamily
MNVAEITDEEALTRAIEGDSEAFSTLYQRYVGRIYNYIYYRTGSLMEAEDLTARVFFRAMGNIAKYHQIGVPFSAWLYRIAHNLVANWYRDNSRRKEVPLEDAQDIQYRGEHPEAALEISQEKERMLSIIRKQPPERQQLLILKFVEGMSNAEVAVIMGRSEGAIKSLYHRTLIAMRQEIENIV